MKTKKIAVLIIAFLLMMSCEKKPKTSGGQGTQPNVNTQDPKDDTKKNGKQPGKTTDKKEPEWLYTTDIVNLRQEPSQQGNKIGQIPKGQKVQVLEIKEQIDLIDGEKGKWTRVQYEKSGKKSMGWVFGVYLTEQKKDDPIIDDMDNNKLVEKYTTDILNLRKKAGTDGEKIAQIPAKQKVQIMEVLQKVELIGGTKGSWTKIQWTKDKKQYQGWVFGAYLSSKKPE